MEMSNDELLNSLQQMIDVAEEDAEIAISYVMVALNDEYQMFMIFKEWTSVPIGEGSLLLTYSNAFRHTLLLILSKFVPLYA